MIQDSISKAISKGLFATPKCNSHTQAKADNGECCQTQKTYTHSWYNLFKEDHPKCCQKKK